MPLKVNVTPGSSPRATHDISLSDGVETWGGRLDGGPRGIQEVPQTPSTLRVTPGGQKFGDWDPSFSHLEQSTWVGGRGQETFADDPSKFFDSQNCWTLTPNKPAWRYTTTSGEAMPWYGSVRQFRQGKDEEWSKVIERVTDALSAKIGSEALAA